MSSVREQWSSRPAFIVAAIGSAIGFGNVWRFPNLAYRYGGGTFLIPYTLSLFLIGIPVLILEISIGQYYQTGDAGAFGRVSKRFRGLGLASVFSAFVIVLYYNVLLAWVCRMFIFSIEGSEGRWAGVSGAEAFDWFVNTVTGLETAPDLIPTRLIGANVGALAFVWFVVYLSLAFGVKWTGRLAYVTVGIPVVFLFVLLVRGVTLDGASEGIRAYIGNWDFSVLSGDSAVWSEAAAQVFFSLTIAFGVMTAYGSYNPRESPVFLNSLIIAFANSAFSFVSGFAVFGIVGYLAQRSNVSIDELERLSGPGLMFGTYPVALSTLPGAGSWERLFFITLFMLGFDSAFSIVEGVATVISDTALFRGASRAVVLAVVSVVGFLGGLVFCTDTGLLFLDATDFYVNFLLLLVGCFECFSVGWMYGLEEQIREVGATPVYSLMATSFIPIIAASGVWFGVVKNEPPSGWSASDWALMWGFIVLSLGLIIGLGVTYWASKRERKHNSTAGILSAKDFTRELFLGNVLRLRKKLSPVVRYIPMPWFYLIRFFIPQVLLVLFANLAASEHEGKGKFGNYEGYSARYQAIGILFFSIAVAFILVGLLVPDLFACFNIQTFDEGKGEDLLYDDDEEAADSIR